MKIKAIVLAVALSATSILTYAQKSEVTAAKTKYETYAKLKEAGSAGFAVKGLQEAKVSIDKAVAHEKTANDAAAWTYRALIYAELAVADSIETTNTPLYNTAVESSKKAATLDTDGANKAYLASLNDIFAQYHMNAGVRAYQKNNFAGAYTSFKTGLGYRPGDTTFAYYGGLAAINAKRYPDAIGMYRELIKTNFSQNKSIYLDLARLYAMEKDTTQAIAVAAEGAQKFNDSDLATMEIEFNLMQGKEKEVITKISDQIAKNPNNKTQHFYLGLAYNAVKEYDKAEAAYKKSIEIDPAFADGYLNLGGLILNKAIQINNAANQLPTNKQKEYDEEIKKASAEADRALPYLNKATELTPKSRLAWENLKTYYLLKRNQAKADEISKKIETL